MLYTDTFGAIDRLCAYVLEHSISSSEVTPAKEVARMEEVLVIPKKGQALAKLEQSIVEETHQGLTQELNNLSTINKELERELHDIY